MRPARRSFLALMAGLAGGWAGCGGRLVGPPDAPACAAPGASVALLDLPFSPGENSFAGWLDEGSAIVADVRGEGALEAAIIDVEARALRPLSGALRADEGRSPREPRAHYVLGDGRLAVIGFVTLADAPLSAVIIDGRSGAITPIADEGAPRSGASLSTPRASVRVGARWALWPRAVGPDALSASAGGHVLDLAAARWRPAPALPPRQGPHVVALPDGRIALWGGSDGGVVADEGVLLDLDAGEVGRFPHPALPTDLTARDGLVLAAVAVGDRGIVGYLLDLGRGDLIPLERRLDPSWRNRRLLHLRGDHLAYLAREGLHLWERSSRRWRIVRLPFEADAPGDLAIHDMVDGTWLISGSEYGDVIFDPATGACCRLSLRTSLTVVTAVAHSARDRLLVGGARIVEDAPDCPPGAPCAIPEPRREEDPRVEVVRLR